MSRRQGLCRKMLLALLLVLCVGAPMTASAQQSTFQQFIVEPDCSMPGDCAMEPPTVTLIDPNGNRPIIKGVYDAAFSKYLRISFGGRVYVLNIDEQLRAMGKEWELDLGALSRPLEPGAYELIVETEGYDGGTGRVNVIVILTPPQAIKPGVLRPEPEHTPPGTPAVPLVPSGPDETPQPMLPTEARARVSLVPFLFTVAVTALCSIFAIVRRRGGEQE